ncbi:glycosyltransferase [Terasakiella sp. A23]|uniref:glycosyltransferase n=1 Tax=Terasakiella sp. FCG-A23 TaxID=3080561 RepID=UPI00295593F0|nr:glycosyltransferase [Terasakiella sp. A23]MDV7339202.1 glycosyltransferase [Terasakiella sp. A23]
MHITIIDDSIAYDGNSPMVQPMGGTEKAVASLAPALAKRGHDVCVVNRIEQGAMIDGVSWVPFDGPRPPETDVVICVKKPALLDEFPDVEKKLLWLATPAKLLNKPKNQALMEKHNPIVVFMGDTHFRTWEPWKYFRKGIVTPGVRKEYLTEAEYTPEDPPRVIVTTNPLHGLDGVLDLWVDKILPQVDWKASLHIYSAGLYRGQSGAPVPEKLQPIFDKVQTLNSHNIVVHKPGSDLEMAMAYRHAACHLYPGVETEMYCSTLAETQAIGLPCVARPVGACSERVKNGQTGFLVPDLDSMANVTVHLLTKSASRENMSRDCRMMQRTQTWDMAAAEFEALL